MTGPDLPFVGAAALVGKAVLGEDAKLKDQLREHAKNSPPMNQAAVLHARRIAVKQAILLRLYQPLARLIGIQKEYFDQDFGRDMAEKLQHIPDEHLGTPSASVAAPAMEGLSLSLDEPDLKEMYLNLLATATDSRVRANAHPAFSQVIKQLSADEAALLLPILRGGILAIVEIRRVQRGGPTGGGNWTPLRRHLISLVRDGQPYDNPLVPTYVDNWVRLGLVNVSYSEKVAADGAYNWAKLRPEYVTLQAEQSLAAHPVPDGEVPVSEPISFVVEAAEGVLQPTSFGLVFLQAVGAPA